MKWMDSKNCPMLFLAPNSNSKSKSNVSNPKSNVSPSLMLAGIQSCNGYRIHRWVACSHMDNWLLHGRVAHTWTIASHIDEWLTHGRRLAYTSTSGALQKRFQVQPRSWAVDHSLALLLFASMTHWPPMVLLFFCFFPKFILLRCNSNHCLMSNNQTFLQKT